MRGTAGNGAVRVSQMAAARAEGGGDAVKGFRWVVVTGLIDWRAQVAAYKTVFAETQPVDQQLDPPEYASYRIERAEVNPLDDSPPTKWERIYFTDMAKRVSEGGGVSSDRGNVSDPVDPWYMGDRAVAPDAKVRFVFPLPPWRTGRGARRISHPEIPWRDAGATGPVGDAVLGGGRGTGDAKRKLPGEAPAPDAKSQPDEPGKAGAKPPAPKVRPTPTLVEDPDAPARTRLLARTWVRPSAGGAEPPTRAAERIRVQEDP